MKESTLNKANITRMEVLCKECSDDVEEFSTGKFSNLIEGEGGQPQYKRNRTDGQLYTPRNKHSSPRNTQQSNKPAYIKAPFVAATDVVAIGECYLFEESGVVYGVLKF